MTYFKVGPQPYFTYGGGGYFSKGRVYLPRHGAHKARKVRWITRDEANNS